MSAIASLPEHHQPLGRLSKEPRLAKRVAIITGASQGFGQAIAIRFVEEGCKVVLVSRRGCDATMKILSTIEGVANVDDIALDVKCDIGKEDMIKILYAKVEEKFGPALHVLVNNAAMFVFHSVETASAKDWANSCNVNIIGSAMMTKHALPLLKKGAEDVPGGATVVFQGSISSFLAQPNCVTYSATKAAILQLAKNCAYDLAKYNIRVNTVCAGTVETPISKVERASHGWTFEEWEKLKVKDVMLRRVGNTREVANATLFYASSESSYCTGGFLMVDGGQTSCTVMTDD
jgi:NAD(P)-dependent dehydrogenase (short-subunit alcohol dehydrogenase family)|eukprot:g1172.t1